MEEGVKWGRERGENGEREREREREREGGKNSAERNTVKKSPLLLVQ